MKTSKSVVLIKAPCMEAYESLNTKNHFVALGPLYLHAYLRKNNVQVHFFDPEAEGLNRDQLVRLIKEKSPLIIGINCFTSNYIQARNLAAHIKTQFKDAFIILGGPHASAAPETTLNLDGDIFDFLCIGEGEKTLLELYHALKNNGDVSGIKGLAYRFEGTSVINETRSYIDTLDDIPFPSWDQINFKNYSPQANFYKGMSSATIITSRGCPFKCDYCQSKLTLGRKIRFHSADYVLSQIEELYHTYGIRYFRFVDDVFTVNHNRLQHIMEGLEKRQLKIKFWCMTRANMVSNEMLKLLKKGGLDSISIGVESGDNDILKDIGKGITRQDVKKAFSLVKKNKIESQAFFMLGFYHDTDETIKRTIKFAIELNPVFVTFTVLVPYPGTLVFDKHYKNRIDF